MKPTTKIVLNSLIVICFSFGYSQNKVTDSLKRVLKVTKVDTTKASIYNQLANEYKESNTDTTFYYSKKALELSKKINFEYGIATSYINQGNTYLILGDYKTAKNNFEKAKSSFETLIEKEDKTNFKNGLARSYASLGVIYSQKGNYYEALDHYKKALEIYQSINQKTGISKIYNNIGVVYKSRRNNKKALEFYKKALAIQQETGEEIVPVTLTNIGVIYFEDNDLKNAFTNYSKAENLFKTIDNIRGKALLYNYLGDYYLAKKNIQKAIEYYSNSVALYESIENKFGASLAIYNLGLLYQEQKETSKAMEFGLKSLTYANEIGVLDQKYHSELLVSELYSSLNQPDKAFFHYKNYIVARDSLLNEENVKKFDRAEMDFEYQKKKTLLHEKSKQQTILLIASIIGGLLLIGLVFLYYNRRQVKRKLTLQKELAEYEQKALHLQMNPHFVFNCLGSISSFIVQNGTDQALKYLSKFSKLMRLTLEYSKGSLIPIDKEIESLQNYLELEQLRFHNKFTFQIKSSDRVEFNMGIPPLLIQPFVENAILHGVVPKEGNGNIKVLFDKENNQLLCTIIDDGIGITKSKEMKEQSVQAHKSMALDITKKRLEIMEATIAQAAQIDIKEDNGTIVTLRLPIQYIQ